MNSRSGIFGFLYSIRHSGYGIAFGLLFPLAASAVESLRVGEDGNSILDIYASIPLVIRVMAPILLGGFALWMSKAGERNARQKQLLAETRARHAEELEERNQKLRELNKTLEGLVYTASHELKTPVLNFKSMLNMLHAVEGEDNSEELREDILKRMEQSTDRFLQTIADLLKVSESQSDTLENPEIVNFESSIRSVLTGISQTIREKQGKIVVETDDFPEISFSPTALNNMFQNLILNSLQFSHPDRKPIITIQSYKENGSIVVSVQDNGQGMNLEQHGDKIFDMFTRFHADTSGNGVGLYLVKKHMEKAGGTVEVKSELGVGTTFYLRFSAKSLPFREETTSGIGSRSLLI